MKISRTTVLVLALVWGAILLVPSLNYYFRLQVRDESEMRAALAIMPSPADTPNFWEKAARRFPEERDVLYQAALERPGEVGGESDIFEWVYGPFPIDPKLPSSVIFPGRAAGDTRAEWLRRIELLRRKFPQDAFLVAAEIRARLFSLKLERTGGELSDPLPRAKRLPGYVSPERGKEKTNFTPADFQKTITLCRLGQKLEPENGYFDWMECYFLMHSWHDGEALKALEAVGRKKQYDDYVLGEMRAEINALSIVWGRPLLYEEKSALLASNIYTPNSRYRELARIISWEGIKAQRRGDRAQAFRIAAALARSAAKMRDDSRSYTDGLTVMAIEAIGWHSLTYDRPGSLPEPMRSEESRKRQLQVLLAYLTEHGQPKLAAEVAQSEVLSQNFRKQMRENGDRAAYGISYRTAFSILLLWVSGIKLLLLLLAPVLALLLMVVGKRTAAVRRWLRWNESGANEVPPAREVWHGVLACVGLRVWVTVLCTSLLISPIVVILSGGWAAFLQQFHEAPFFKGLFQDGTTAWYSSPWVQFYLSLIDVAYIDSPWRIVVFCIPILLGTLYAVWRAVEWQKRRNGESVNRLSAVVVDFVIMLVLIGSFFVQAFAEDFPRDFAVRLILALVTLVCATVLLGEKFLIWRKRPHRRATVRYGVRLLQRSFATWLMVGSVIYLLTLVATATMRHRADVEIDRVVEMGEVRAAQQHVE